MSFLRRVKSFTVKKSKSINELKEANDADDATSSPRKRLIPSKRRQLVRQKSMSLESVLLRHDLENNQMFQRRKKLTDDTIKEVENEGKTDKLLKRTSISLDERHFNNHVENKIELRQTPKITANHRCNTVDVYSTIMSYSLKKYEKSIEKNALKEIKVTVASADGDPPPLTATRPFITNLTKSKSDWYINLTPSYDELIKEFHEKGSDDVTSTTINKPFPVDDEAEVEVRAKPSRPSIRPKTFTSSSSTVTRSNKESSFEVRGPFRLEIGIEKCIKVRQNEKLKLTDGQLDVVELNGFKQSRPVKRHVDFGKDAILMGKKDVAIKDGDNVVYTFHFDTSKECKMFMERTLALNEKTTSIKTRLLKLLGKRSSRDLLESKGIIRNEPIFGNTLRDLYKAAGGIPEFITRIVEMIEEEPNVKSVGLYRASANLATVQKIRCEVDCGRLEILETYRRDVDVLAGSLKLFFRELMEPLIPYSIYQKLQKTIETSPDDGDIEKIINELPEANRVTLLYILRHLVTVCRYKSDNKMDSYNMAVSWGPSLIGIPPNCSVAETTQFHKVTEYLLNYYEPKFAATPQDKNSLKLDRVAEPVAKTDYVYDVIEKITKIVDSYLHVKGIYRKSGSSYYIDEIVKKIHKQQLAELNRYDIHDLCCALKKYLFHLPQPLIPYEIFEQYCQDCDNLNTIELRAKLRDTIEAKVPRKEALKLLIHHLQRVVQHEKDNKMSLSTICNIWTGTLFNRYEQQNREKLKKFQQFFEILMNLNDDFQITLPEHNNRVRDSRYDNVPDDIKGEADILDDKTETKL